MNRKIISADRTQLKISQQKASKLKQKEKRYYHKDRTENTKAAGLKRMQWSEEKQDRKNKTEKIYKEVVAKNFSKLA